LESRGCHPLAGKLLPFMSRLAGLPIALIVDVLMNVALLALLPQVLVGIFCHGLIFDVEPACVWIGPCPLGAAACRPNGRALFAIGHWSFSRTAKDKRQRFHPYASLVDTARLRVVDAWRGNSSGVVTEHDLLPPMSGTSAMQPTIPT
jgi:hypothetical protein